MPAQHRLRPHDQQDLRQAAPVQRLGEHRQDRAVRVGEPRPGHLALQHEDLVAQRQDLGVSPVAREGQQPDAGEHETHEPRQRTEHGPDPT
jgi:hypothetical protein